MTDKKAIIPKERIEKRIYFARQQKVLLGGPAPDDSCGGCGESHFLLFFFAFNLYPYLLSFFFAALREEALLSCKTPPLFYNAKSIRQLQITFTTF